MHAIPPKCMTWLLPDMELVIDLEYKNREQIKEIIRTDFKDATHPTIFYEVLHSNLPPQEKELDRVFQEGQTVLGAGTETVSATLSHSMFFILDTPNVLKQLREELLTLMPSPDAVPTWSQLEKLPYLSAVIQEGLRFSAGVSLPEWRVAPRQVLHYKGWTIPAGTCVGMSLMQLNNDPVKFPEPDRFIPERWLNKDAGGLELYSFGKGTRMCIGIK